MESTAPAQTTKAPIDVQQVVTDEFISRLKNGNVPWHVTNAKAGMPVNLITNEPYRGINALLLLMADCQQNLFVTFDQVKEIKGKVKRGVKGYRVVRWERPKDGGDQSSQNNKQGQNKLKYYTVFNIEQCEVPEAALAGLSRPQLSLSADLITQCMPNCPKIVFGTREAHYDVVEDVVHALKSKKKDAAYYSCLFHLLVHSTGRDHRVARQGVAEMGELLDYQLYSKEELIAAIGTAFLLVRTGVELKLPINAEYANGWLEKLQADKRLIFQAAKEAQKAVDYILNVKPSTEEK